MAGAGVAAVLVVLLGGGQVSWAYVLAVALGPEAVELPGWVSIEPFVALALTHVAVAASSRRLAAHLRVQAVACTLVGVSLALAFALAPSQPKPAFYVFVLTGAVAAIVGHLARGAVFDPVDFAAEDEPTPGRREPGRREAHGDVAPPLRPTTRGAA